MIVSNWGERMKNEWKRERETKKNSTKYEKKRSKKKNNGQNCLRQVYTCLFMFDMN